MLRRLVVFLYSVEYDFAARSHSGRRTDNSAIDHIYMRKIGPQINGGNTPSITLPIQLVD